MKTIFKLITVALVFLLIGCSTETTSTPESSIYGHWVLESKTQDGVNVPLTDCEHLNSIDFRKNNSYIRTKFSKVEQNCIPDNMTDTNRKYTFDSFHLVMTYDDVEFGPVVDNAIVSNLTNNSMDMSVEFDDDDNGYYTFHFIKQ